jgi:Holliday junction DNA helicase RuvA
MIGSLRGEVAEKSGGEALIDVQGVGYRVSLSLVTLAQLPPLGETVRLRIRTVVREDAFDLFGFLSEREEALFLLLTSVSHVGPKMALAVLSGLEVDALTAALAAGDVARLTKIHGVGKKTAERLVLELREKAKALTRGPALPSSSRVEAMPGLAADGPHADLVSALVNLGYKELHAQDAAKRVAERLPEEAAFELQVREALRVLRSSRG